MEWKPAKTNEDGSVKIPNQWLHLHYYEALNILFRFENSLRVFVYVILKNELEDKWITASYTLNGQQASIKSLASGRIKQAENFGYLGFEVKSPLMHLTSGELVELITSDAYWSKFNSYFRGSKDIIKNKLLEIGTVRNSLAHFRPIKPDDIELIKQNTRHTLMGVEECLTNIFSQYSRVPTNTEDTWYKEISSVGNEYVNIIPYYSKNEKWVDIQVIFKSPQISKQKYSEEFYSYDVGKIKPADILIHHPDLTKNVIYISENIMQPAISPEYDSNAQTILKILFSKQKLIDKTAEIVQVIKDICVKINEECTLITQDTLARGDIIESANFSIWYQKQDQNNSSGKWRFMFDSLYQPYEPEHPNEYWGVTNHYITDIISGVGKYPWMQSDISSKDSFF